MSKPLAVELGTRMVPTRLILAGWWKWRRGRHRTCVACYRARITLPICTAVYEASRVVLGKPIACIRVVPTAVPVGIVQKERWR